MSESGKSFAGELATSICIFRLKIIYFERLIAKNKDFDMNDKNQIEISLKKMYSNEEIALKEFRDYIYAYK